MISFSGQGLYQLPAEEAALLNAFLPFDRLNDFARPSWPSRNLTDFAFPFFERRPPIELNSLWWPVGASRWAVGYFLATEATKNAIQTANYGTYTSTTLTFTDQTNTVSTSMFLLPPRPLKQCFDSNPVVGQKLPTTAAGGLWLITLVDDRYHWWLRSTTLDIASGETWATLFAAIGTALNVAITVDAVPSAYLSPPVDFMSRYDYLPILLDAAAYSVGMRVVRHLDGTISVQGPSTASTQWQTGIANSKLAGGEMFLLAPNNADEKALVPANVAVSFATTRSSFPNCVPYVKTVSTGISGVDTRYFQSCCVPAYDTAGNLLNQTEMDALATQLKSDWVAWQRAPLDVQWMGCLNWTPEGMHDVYWTDNGLPMVRVYRTPWNEWQQQLLHSGTYGSTFYTQIAAVIKVTGPSKQGNYYDATIAGEFNAASPAFMSLQPVWLYDPESNADLSAGQIIATCTLIGQFQGRPIYALPVTSLGIGSSGVVRVTAATKDGTSKMWRAQLQAFADGNPPVMTDDGFVWAFAPNGGPLTNLAPSAYYVATFVLVHSDNNPVYAVAGTVISVACSGNTIQEITA